MRDQKFSYKKIRFARLLVVANSSSKGLLIFLSLQL